MSASPWVITSTKRKTKSLTPPSQKRPRLNGIQGKSSTSRRSRNSQQTLTQAQWLTPPTSFEEEDGQFAADEGEGLRLRRATDSRRTVKKRNSTLTQMDFFSFPPPDNADFDDTWVPLVDGGNDPLPQLDGTYDSPRRPRRQKAAPSTANTSTKRKIAPMHAESQEYKPSTRKRKAEVEDYEPSSSRRRTSRRLASRNDVFSDPVQNLAYFEEALGTITPKNNNDNNKPRGTLGYPLEIQDSNETDVDDLDIAGSMPQGRTLLPHTPKKNRGIVLSSQSPESLPPSTRRTCRKISEPPAPFQRTPLAERSVNIPLGPKLKLSPGKSRRAPKRSLMKTTKKIVTLRLPKRSHPRQPKCIEDSQANLWSIPSSSSPRQQGNQIVQPPADAQAPAQAPLYIEAQDTDAEIPSTSQAQGVQSSPTNVETQTQDTLPDISEFIGDRRGLDAQTPDCANYSPTKSVNAMRDDSNPLEQDGDFDVEDSDFGSPIANDTQFNVAVDHRVSSPPPLVYLHQTESTATAGLLLNHSPTALHQSQPGPEGDVLNPALIEVTVPLQQPLPVPRLVEQSPVRSPPKRVPDSEDDSDEMVLPKPATLHRSSTHVSTTKIPLNDIGQQSSSPSLPSTKAGTPKSVRPASLPHPSQMSTQEATQGYFNMFSYTPEDGEQESDESKVEKITIKDSSSCHIPMSQLPQYTGESQSQVNIDLGLDKVFTDEDEEDEEEGDLDLDPPTLCPQPDCVLTEDQQLATQPQPRGRGQKAKGKAIEPEDDIDHDELGVSQTQALNTMDSSQSISIPSSPNPPRLERQYSPIPGFNNETQSNFTQNGHVTAAYIHRKHEAGVLPKWFIPQPYQVPGYTRRK
ncbi:hypothetical protein A1O3_01710 [Capronia epimyces CBS 606.96]|uniref:Uncharacterized protein n=1 Tax=Capronia epimyces CBS 606.96 TaxID=1182542 RepID=W9YKR0_9EURO|nr:uncharacterized protein A1O3_01710 [Capronia epimyces CBS 606.96]EXJ93153.1 hypothetical protein A1O3_01710 [Capronia epimyces CBS 606.96]